jgi:hypothetical protein
MGLHITIPRLAWRRTEKDQDERPLEPWEEDLVNEMAERLAGLHELTRQALERELRNHVRTEQQMTQEEKWRSN